MGNGDGKKVEKATGPVTIPGKASVALPKSCRNEAIVWKNVCHEVANILAQSDSWTRTWSANASKVQVVSGTPLRPDQLGLAGRVDPKNRDLIGLQFAWSKIKSRFELASLYAHEYMHAHQALTRRHTLGEAAPFLSLNQYIILRWASEFEAFNFQALVLKEIVATMPEFAPCLKPIRIECVPVRLLLDGKVADARDVIASTYSVWRLSDEHRKESTVTPEQRKALEDVKNNVEINLKSDPWKREEKTWTPLLPA